MGERRHSTGDIPETSAFKTNSICGLEEEWTICHIYLSSKMTTVPYIRQLTRPYWGLRDALNKLFILVNLKLIGGDGCTHKQL